MTPPDTPTTAALAEASRYRALAEAAHDAIFILNGQNHFEYANGASLERMNATLPDIVGRSLVDCFPPGVGRELEEEVNGVRSGGAALHVERAVRFPAGTRWMSTWLVPVPDATGRPCDIMGIARDVTDRHEMAALLERQHALLSAVIQHSSVGIVVVNEDSWTCEMVNAAACAFIGGELVPGARLTDVWSGAATQLVPLLQRAVGTAAPQSLDVDLERPAATGADPTPRRAAVMASRLQLPHHTGAAVLLMLTDVTERRRLEDQFLQAQKMEAIGRLAGGVAHDFNNLLTPIIGYAELVMSTFADNDPRRQDLDEVCHAAHSASALTRRLLTFSRKQVIEPVVLDLNDVIAEIEKIVRRTIGEDVEVTVSCAPNLGHIRADRTQLEQVVMNLSVNARDAMPEGGRLLLTTSEQTLSHVEAGARRPIPPGRYVVLSVTDTGTGMSPDVQSHLFEPFFTTKGLGKGTGLGLSTVYGIVQQSGAYLSVRSAAGQGTTFLLYFPRTDAVTAPGQGVAASAPRSLQTGHETILIVEDNDGLRRLAERVLTNVGYRVLAAQDPDDAMRVARAYQAPIHLMLTDLVMPKTDGLTLTRQMAAERPDTHVLLMSGYAGDDILHGGNVPASMKLLQKPFTQASLTQAVRQVLDTLAIPLLELAAVGRRSDGSMACATR